MAAKRGIINNTVFVGTDMNEKDTVFGASESLGDITKKYMRGINQKPYL